MKAKFIMILILLCGCKSQTTYYSKEENMQLYANQTKENIHRPIKLDLTKKWIAKADSVDLKKIKIDVIGKKTFL